MPTSTPAMNKPVPEPRKRKINLPRRVEVGGRARLRESRRGEYERDCKLAGYDTDVINRIVTITREDDHSGRRLWFDGAPHCFWAQDCELAWNSDEDRRKALRERGWKV